MMSYKNKPENNKAGKEIFKNNCKIIDAHVHILTDKERNLQYSVSGLNYLKLLENNLRDFKKKGGELVIDCTPYDCGRNGNILYEISKKTDVEIIFVTGFHKREYYAQDSEMWELDFKYAKDFFIKELKIGLKETVNGKEVIKAGIIKVPFVGLIGSEYKNLTDAALNVAAETNVPILVHTEKGNNIEWFADYVEEKGVKPQKVVFCHIDKRNDICLHKKLALRGFYLEYDTFLREKYQPKKNTYDLIDSMVREGLGKSIMLGSDIFGKFMWEKVSLSDGYGGFFNKLYKDLYTRIKDSNIAFNLIGGNAARFLSGNSISGK